MILFTQKSFGGENGGGRGILNTKGFSSLPLRQIFRITKNLADADKAVASRQGEQADRRRHNSVWMPKSPASAPHLSVCFV